MVRVLNFLFVAITGLACLALYRVSEDTRMANLQLAVAQHQILQEHAATTVLQAEWSKVANPARIQQLAEEQLGLTDMPSIELSSLELLPRRGQALNPGDAPIRNASDEVPVQDAHIHPASVRTGF
ncbi:MAG TPA: hypothetical protein VH000_01685 [Rhizomicrobium sp.]|jgi:cell division protein FtsL|nr:hypothetical protein [Rhizomicrobium sp.]